MDVALIKEGLQLEVTTTAQFQNHLRKYITFSYKSQGCNSLDSRHLEILAGVERTEEINSNVLFCFI